MEPKIAILGSVLNGGACQILDAAYPKYKNENFFLYDDEATLITDSYLNVPIRGGIEQAFIDYKNKKITHFVVGVCSLPARSIIFQNAINHGLNSINIVSNESIVSRSISIGKGNIILPNTYIGPNVIIGNNNYITCGSNINHDTKIDNNNYFSTCVAIAGRVIIGSNIRFGTNSAVTACTKVPSNSLIKDGEIFGFQRGR